MDGNFDMNLYDFEQNKKVQNFLNIVFGHSMMSTVNKLTRVTKDIATAIYNIFYQLCYHNQISNRNYKMGYFRSFSNILFSWLQYLYKRNQRTLHIYAWPFLKNSVEKFKYKLGIVN